MFVEGWEALPEEVAGVDVTGVVCTVVIGTTVRAWDVIDGVVTAVKTGGAMETINSELVTAETELEAVGTAGKVAVGWTGDTVCTANVDVEAVDNGWVYTVAGCG